jgi:hypothetical protein
MGARFAGWVIAKAAEMLDSRECVTGLDPGIHVFILRYRVKDVDGRVKPGHGEK